MAFCSVAAYSPQAFLRRLINGANEVEEIQPHSGPSGFGLKTGMLATAALDTYKRRSLLTWRPDGEFKSTSGFSCTIHLPSNMECGMVREGGTNGVATSAQWNPLLLRISLASPTLCTPRSFVDMNLHPQPQQDFSVLRFGRRLISPCASCCPSPARS